jgi:hypothetical protein
MVYVIDCSCLVSLSKDVTIAMPQLHSISNSDFRSHKLPERFIVVQLEAIRGKLIHMTDPGVVVSFSVESDQHQLQNSASSYLELNFSVTVNFSRVHATPSPTISEQRLSSGRGVHRRASHPVSSCHPSFSDQVNTTISFCNNATMISNPR